MKKLIGIALILGLGGCSTIGSITGTSVPPSTAIVAANSFDALETLATGYLQLPVCGGAVVTCRSATVVGKLVPAIRSGRAARNSIEKLVSAGSTSIPIASYNTLAAAISSLQAIYTEYGIKG